MSDAIDNLHKELGKVFVHGSNKWSSYNSQCLLYRKKPVLGTVNQKEIEQMAKEKCKDRMGECSLSCLL